MDSVSPSDMLYMEAKSIFVQLIRSIPGLAEKRPYNLAAIAERAATTKDATLVRKGIKVKEMLRELEEQKIVDRADGYKLMQDEVSAELVHLGNLREKVLLETKSLEAVYKTICDHNNYLRSQLEQYKAYLQNVRLTASKDKGSSTGVGVVTVGGKEKKPAKPQVLGPYRFTHAQLEKEAVIRQHVAGIKAQREQGLHLVRSLVAAQVEQVKVFVSDLGALLREGAFGKAVTLVGEASFETYLVSMQSATTV